MLERLAGDAAAMQAELAERQAAIAAALATADSGDTVYETHDGQIRIVVTGRLRIREFYVSERALRAPAADRTLLTAANEALTAARTAHARRLRAGLDPQLAKVVEAATTSTAASGDTGSASWDDTAHAQPSRPAASGYGGWDDTDRREPDSQPGAGREGSRGYGGYGYAADDDAEGYR